jgi:2-octaprenyl-6-methoxyphenol hydroxylase
MADDAELVIAGGGLNGMLLAVACASAGLSTIVIDRQDPAAMIGDRFDGRTSAIAYGSRLVFDGIGLWPAIEGEAEPIREIRVADDGSPLFLHYDHRELGVNTPLGYIFEYRVLRRALFDQAATLPSLRLLAPRMVGAMEASEGGATVALADGMRLRTRLVTAADGQNSPLRRGAGIRTVEWRYRQTGIVTTVAHARPHRGIAVEHFLPAGPFAILPMTGNRSSIVWTEDADLAPRLLALPDAKFAAELRARFGDFLGEIEPLGPRWSYPLALMQAERYVARRLALIGEAAHVIHPIAGHGQYRHPRHRRAGRDHHRRAPPRPRYRRPVLARTVRALAPLGRADARGGDRRAQPAVLEHDPAGQAGARFRPRDGQPPAALKAPPDAARDGRARRPPAIGEGGAALISVGRKKRSVFRQLQRPEMFGGMRCAFPPYALMDRGRLARMRRIKGGRDARGPD